MASIINASTSTGLVTTADTSGVLQLQTGGATAVTVDASQNVGIGTASPVLKLDVSGKVKFTGVEIAVSEDYTTNLYYSGGWKYRATGYGTTIGASSGAITFNNTASSGTADAAATVSERMRIDSSGRVGIANTSPSVNLEIGADNSTVRVLAVRYSSVPVYLSSSFDGTLGLSTLSSNNYNTSNGSSSWSSFSNTGYGSSAVQLAVGTGGADIRFLTAAAANTNPSERARITSGGGFVVGGTTLTSGSGVFQAYSGPFPIWAQGSSSGYCQGAFVSASGTDAGPGGRGQGMYMWNQGNNTTWYMGTVYGAADTWYVTRKAATGFQDDAAQSTYAKMWVTNSGVAFQGNNSSTWSTVSDARVKEDVQTIENGLDVVLALRPVEYFNKITKKREENFIAQEYEQVLAGHVSREKPTPGEQEFVTDEILRLNPNLVPYLVSAIKELKALVDTQASTITSLTDRITALEGTTP